MALTADTKWVVGTFGVFIATTIFGFGVLWNSNQNQDREITRLNQRQDKEISRLSQDLTRIEEGFWRWGKEKDRQVEILFNGFNDRLKRMEDKAFGSTMGVYPHHADLVVVSEGEPERLYENQLSGLKRLIDRKIQMTKNPELSAEDLYNLKDEIWSLQIEYQILLTRRLYCEIDEVRKKRCLALDQQR